MSEGLYDTKEKILEWAKGFIWSTSYEKMKRC